MSPPPPADPEDVNALLKDSAVSGALGGMAMVARLLMSTEKATWGYVARRIIIAFIVGFFASMVVKDYISSVKLQFAAVGALSYSAPEVCDFVLSYVRAKTEKEIQSVKRSKRS